MEDDARDAVMRLSREARAKEFRRVPLRNFDRVLCRDLERGVEPLQAIRLVRPDIGEEATAIVLARGAERILIVAEPGGNFQRRIERRRLAAPFRLDAYTRLRIAQPRRSLRS